MTGKGNRRRQLASQRFACFSILGTALARVTAALMAGAVTNGAGFGLYQRLNYAMDACWLAALLWLARRQPSSRPEPTGIRGAAKTCMVKATSRDTSGRSSSIPAYCFAISPTAAICRGGQTFKAATKPGFVCVAIISLPLTQARGWFGYLI